MPGVGPKSGYLRAPWTIRSRIIAQNRIAKPARMPCPTLAYCSASSTSSPRPLAPISVSNVPGYEFRAAVADIRGGVFDLDDNTLVIAQPKEAARIIELLKGKGASYALNASLRPQVNATGRPYAVVSVNAAKLPPSAELTNSGFQGAVFAMGENGSNQIMKISAFFTSKEKAAPMAMQAQGMMAMAPMMLAGDPTKPETAEEKEMKALAAEFLAGIQPVEAAGNQVTLTAKWETLKLFGMLEKIVAIGATKTKSAPQPLTK